GYTHNVSALPARSAIRARSLYLVRRAIGALPAAEIQRKFGGKIRHFGANAILHRGIAEMTKNFADPSSDAFHLWFAHSARGYGGTAHADAARRHRRRGIEWDGILVNGDACAIERRLRVLPRQAARIQVNHEQVIVGAAGNDAKALPGNSRRQRASVGHYLRLILAKCRLHGLF